MIIYNTATGFRERDTLSLDTQELIVFESTSVLKIAAYYADEYFRESTLVSCDRFLSVIERSRLNRTIEDSQAMAFSVSDYDYCGFEFFFSLSLGGAASLNGHPSKCIPTMRHLGAFADDIEGSAIPKDFLMSISGHDERECKLFAQRPWTKYTPRWRDIVTRFSRERIAVELLGIAVKNPIFLCKHMIRDRIDSNSSLGLE